MSASCIPVGSSRLVGNYKTEGWADYAKDLKVLVENVVFQTCKKRLETEQLALNHFLGQLDNPPIAFAVKQSRPRNLDEAVTATLEMKSMHPQDQLELAV